MWRRLNFKIASAWRSSVRSFAEQTVGHTGNEKTGAQDQNSKNETIADQNEEKSNENKEGAYDIIKAVIKTSVCLSLVWVAVKEENKRRGLEEQVVLLGKRGSGVELVCKALLATNERCKQGLLTNQTENEQNMDTALQKDDQKYKRRQEVKGFNQQHQRKMRLTCLYADEITSIGPKVLSSLSTSEDYSVVFCFPFSYRFTEEDENLLETYLKYRKRDDMKGVKVVFTHYGSLDPNLKNYIDKLPDKFKFFLRKCDNQYCFISSNDKLSEEAEKQVKSLVKPVPSDTFNYEIIKMIVVYFFPSLFFAVK